MNTTLHQTEQSHDQIIQRMLVRSGMTPEQAILAVVRVLVTAEVKRRKGRRENDVAAIQEAQETAIRIVNEWRNGGGGEERGTSPARRKAG